MKKHIIVLLLFLAAMVSAADLVIAEKGKSA